MYKGEFGLSRVQMEKKKTDKVKKPIDIQWVTHSIVVIIADILVVIFSYFAALWLRFDMRFQSIPSEYFQTYLRKYRRDLYHGKSIRRHCPV